MTERRPSTHGKMPIHATIARDLGIAIVTGRHSPEEVLPGEIAAGERLHVSRTAYREAVRMLAAKGLVTSQKNSGTRVNARDRWSLLDPEVLGWMFEGEPSLDFIQDLFELRAVIEPAAAAHAASRRTQAHLDRLEVALARMERHGLTREEGRAADRDFHHGVLDATGNTALIALSGTISAAVSWTTVFKQRSGRPDRDVMPDHAAVLDAIRAREPRTARRAMAELVRLSLKDIELQPALRR